MSDAEQLRLLKEAVRSDAQKPVIDQRFNPTDPVAVEIVLHETDFAVEQYMQKWQHLRDGFADPGVYDEFVLDFQMKARKSVKAMIATAQQFIADDIEQERIEEEEPPEDEEDYQI